MVRLPSGNFDPISSLLGQTKCIKAGQALIAETLLAEIDTPGLGIVDHLMVYLGPIKLHLRLAIGSKGV